MPKQNEKLVQLEKQRVTRAFRLVSLLLGLTIALLMVVIGYSIINHSSFEVSLVLLVLLTTYSGALVIIRWQKNLHVVLLMLLVSLYGGIALIHV